jgi:hypothetical protein
MKQNNSNVSSQKPIKKVKRIKIKKDKTTENKLKENRDFTTDLDNYLTNWQNGESSGWKFNKIIQTWAINNVLDTAKFGEELFQKFIPYAKSIQGASKDRLLTFANTEISEENTNDSKKERAKVIVSELS